MSAQLIIDANITSRLYVDVMWLYMYDFLHAKYM